MTFDVLNIIAVFSFVAILVIVWKMWKNSHDEKQTYDPSRKNKSVKEDSDYKKIVLATHWLEHERQRNTGEHFENENVYLNRAQTIKDKTPFFTFVNMHDKEN